MLETKWFGKAYGAPYESDTEHVPTPVGAHCAHCAEPIGLHDDGLLIPSFDVNATHYPFHYECHLRMVVGGLNHQLGCCTCCGGVHPPDPPGMSLREAARLAASYWSARRRD